MEHLHCTDHITNMTGGNWCFPHDDMDPHASIYSYGAIQSTMQEIQCRPAFLLLLAYDSSSAGAFLRDFAKHRRVGYSRTATNISQFQAVSRLSAT